jgi:hypothetical protein
MAAMLEDLGWEEVDHTAEVEIVDGDATGKGERRIALTPAASPVPAGFLATLRKPVRRGDLAAALSLPPSRPPVLGERVAVQDADALHRRILERMVTRLGHELVRDASATVALVVVREEDDARAITEARRAFPAARIVVVAATGDRDRWTAGADAVLDRPVRDEPLAAALTPDTRGTTRSSLQIGAVA